MLLAEQGHFDAAVSVFTAVHESATWFQDAWINLAHVLALRGQHARAINLYRSAAAKFTDGTDVNLLRCTAAAMYSAADFSGAERTLRKALQLEPDDLSLWHNLATAQLGFFEYMLEWGERMEYDMAARAGEADAPPESRYTFHGIRKQRDLDKAEGKFQVRLSAHATLPLLSLTHTCIHVHSHSLFLPGSSLGARSSGWPASLRRARAASCPTTATPSPTPCPATRTWASCWRSTSGCRRRLTRT